MTEHPNLDSRLPFAGELPRASGRWRTLHRPKRMLTLLCATIFGVAFAPVHARDDIAANTVDAPPAPSSGPGDFDFEFGRWRTHLKLLRNPLSGSTTWVEYSGTSVVSRVWDGRANLVELEVDGAAGHIEGLNLRLYNPQTGQWSLNFASSRGGALTPPVYGGFANGRGEFYGQDFLDGRAILVRFVIVPLNPNTIRFEQAFSADGGRNWEVNWIATDTRIGP